MILGKPPIGIKPKSFHELEINSERYWKLYGAIERYLNSHCHIDPLWITEYNELIEYFKEHNSILIKEI